MFIRPRGQRADKAERDALSVREMGEPLYSKEQWSDDLFVRDTAAETAAGERFVDFMLNTHGRTRGAKPPPTTQYEPLRRTFVSDPNLNNGLKTAEVESHWSLEAENARHWAIAEGGTFGRSKRFPKGDTLIDQRKLHKPAQRFYNVDKGRSLGKRARPARSVWPRAETKSEFEIAQAREFSLANAGKGVEWATPHPDVWVPREVCGVVPGSAMFRSRSERTLEKLDGFDMVGVENTGGPTKGAALGRALARPWPTPGPRPAPSPHGQKPPIDWVKPSAGFKFPKADRMTHADQLLHNQIAQRRVWLRTASQIPGAERLVMPYDGDPEALHGVHSIPRASYLAGSPATVHVKERDAARDAKAAERAASRAARRPKSSAIERSFSASGAHLGATKEMSVDAD